MQVCFLSLKHWNHRNRFRNHSYLLCNDLSMTFSCLITATETAWTTWRCGIAPVTLATVFATNEPLILDLSDDRPPLLVTARKWKAANEQRESKCFPCESLSCISSPPRWPSACCRADLAKGVTGSSAGASGRSRVRSRFKLTRLRIDPNTSQRSAGGGTGGEQSADRRTAEAAASAHAGIEEYTTAKLVS